MRYRHLFLMLVFLLLVVSCGKKGNDEVNSSGNDLFTQGQKVTEEMLLVYEPGIKGEKGGMKMVSREKYASDAGMGGGTGGTGGIPVYPTPPGYTLLDQSDWDDPLTPCYISYDGIYAVGDPGDTTDDEIQTISYYWDSIGETVDAVPNMLNIEFYPTATLQDVTNLIYNNNLLLHMSWWDPKPAEPERSVAWILVELTETSPGYDDLQSAVDYYQAVPTVELAFADCYLFETHDSWVPRDPGFPYMEYPDGGLQVSTMPEPLPGQIGWQDYLKGEDQYHTGSYLDVENAWITGGTMGQVNGSQSRVGIAVLGVGVDWRHDDLFHQLYTDPRQVIFVDGEWISNPSYGKKMGARVLYGKKGMKSGPIREPRKDRQLWDESIDEEALGLPRRCNFHETWVTGIAVAEKKDISVTDPRFPGYFGGVIGCAPDAQFFPIYIKHRGFGMAHDDPPVIYLYSTMIGSYRVLRHETGVHRGFDTLRVINGSGGSRRPYDATFRNLLKQKIEDVVEHNNQLFVASAGNNGEHQRQWPAAFSNVLGVTGVYKTYGDLQISTLTDSGCPSSNYIEDSEFDRERDTYGASAYYKLRPDGPTGSADLFFSPPYGPYDFASDIHVYQIVSTDLVGVNYDAYGQPHWGRRGDDGSDFCETVGTSAASPQVAALAALVWAKHGLATDKDWVRDLIQTNLKTESVPIRDKDGVPTGGWVPGCIDFTATLSN